MVGLGEMEGRMGVADVVVCLWGLIAVMSLVNGTLKVAYRHRREALEDAVQDKENWLAAYNQQVDCYAKLKKAAIQQHEAYKWLLAERRTTQFSRQELTEMIKLCHPDKHGGSEAAGEITKRLLEVRG